MLKKQAIAIIMLVVLLAAIPLCSAADTLAAPTVNLPSGWHLSDESAYPNEPAEHDPEGAGLIIYEDTNNLDFVMIYYEKAQSTFTDAQLKAEAESIFTRDHEGSYTGSGVRTFGSNKAGWAKAHDTENNLYDMEIVIVKNGYYFNAYAGYDDTSQSETNVENLLGSITVNAISSSGSNTIFGLDMTLFIAIIGVVVAVVVVVIVVVVVKRKKKPEQQMMQGTYSPPPPPATQ